MTSRPLETVCLNDRLVKKKGIKPIDESFNNIYSQLVKKKSTKMILNLPSPSDNHEPSLDFFGFNDPILFPAKSKKSLKTTKISPQSNKKSGHR